jgi:cyclic-di-GMP phosphodiesterase TipF (flagellum assembly factor)
MALYNSVTDRMRDRRDLGDQIADLSRGTADLARQVAEIARRLGTLESRPNVGSHVAPRTRSGPDPLAAEIGELGGLVKQLAETVAVHDIEIKRRMALQAMAKPAVTEEPAAAENTAQVMPDELVAETVAETVAAVPLAAAPEPAETRDAITDMIVSAVDSNRIDLYLQPIVTLPQRKVRFYEAMSRLRAENGDIMPAADFIDFAEAAGLMPKIDNLLLFRCVQVVRRLQLKNRDVGLFCNISSATLSDATYFQQFLDFMEANRALAPAMMFEFTQQAYRSFGPIEHESLSALAERGFRFSLDHVEDLRIEPRELADRSFKFIKVPAKLLLNPEAGARADIHPQDLADLMARNGVDLIAERIETESMVLDLLDYDVRFGQGFLFSPPRPVRAEALSGASDAVAKDGSKDGGDSEASDAGAGAVGEPAKAFAARA